MTQASGFQIAFLVFAFEFFSMLTSRWLASALSWPADEFASLGQMVSFTIAPLILILIAPLRRQCAEELRRPIPPGALPELLGATFLKVATLFALIAVVVLQNHFSSPANPLDAGIRIGDDVAQWRHALVPLTWLHSVVFAFVIGPIVEELVFRGFIYRAFEARWGWLPSMAITSVMFGLVHPSHVVSSMIASVIYICVLRRTGSLWASIAVHALHNIVVSWPLVGHLVFSLPSSDAEWNLQAWYFHFACLFVTLVALPLYVWVSRKDARNPEPAR